MGTALHLTTTRLRDQSGLRSLGATYPDLKFIKKMIAIDDVARELGLQVLGRNARCWRSQNHQHGDRTPSIGFNTKKNIGRCFVCDDHAWSNVDLVQNVFDCSTREAIEWIAARYSVPQIPKGRHLSNRQQWRGSFRVGVSGFSLEAVVRSGYWASLTPSEKSILVVFCTFADPSTGATRISYRGIMRYAGIGSYSSVASALKRFEKIGLLDIERRVDEDGFRSCSTYLLKLDSAEFHQSLRDTHQRQRADIDIERQIRSEQKRDQRAARAAYTGKSSLQPV